MKHCYPSLLTQPLTHIQQRTLNRCTIYAHLCHKSLLLSEADNDTDAPPTLANTRLLHHITHHCLHTRRQSDHTHSGSWIRRSECSGPVDDCWCRRFWCIQWPPDLKFGAGEAVKIQLALPPAIGVVQCPENCCLGVKYSYGVNTVISSKHNRQQLQCLPLITL